MFFTGKKENQNTKNDTPNQNRERCFFTCEKNDTSNEKPQRCVSFAPNFPPFIGACTLKCPRFVSCSRKLDWNRVVYKFTIDEVI